MILLRLFYEFFKIGLFSVGGGLATIPFLTDLAEASGWYTAADLANMIAISESTPGPIGVNMASYVGFEVAGVLGCMVATLGLIAPSVITILIIARFLQRFQENHLVQEVFYGLRPASTGLIAAAGFEVMKITFVNFTAYAASHQLLTLVNWKALLLAAALFVAMARIKKHPIVFIAISAVIGAAFRFAGA